MTSVYRIKVITSYLMMILKPKSLYNVQKEKLVQTSLEHDLFETLLKFEIDKSV